jgi:hypothetical protein
MPPQCAVDGTCSRGAYSIQSCFLRHAAYITSFFSSRQQGVGFVGCGLTPHLLCEGATDTHSPCEPRPSPTSACHPSARVYHRDSSRSITGNSDGPPRTVDADAEDALPREDEIHRLARFQVHGLTIAFRSSPSISPSISAHASGSGSGSAYGEGHTADRNQAHRYMRLHTQAHVPSNINTF